MSRSVFYASRTLLVTDRRSARTCREITADNEWNPCYW